MSLKDDCNTQKKSVDCVREIEEVSDVLRVIYHIKSEKKKISNRSCNSFCKLCICNEGELSSTLDFGSRGQNAIKVGRVQVGEKSNTT
jgi:hypothetical protein